MSVTNDPQTGVGAGIEMPRYICHKTVHALRIGDGTVQVHPDGSATFPVGDGGYAPITLTKEITARHWPQPGDYYVVYADGYKSVSPRRAFEEGYQRIP